MTFLRIRHSCLHFHYSRSTTERKARILAFFLIFCCVSTNRALFISPQPPRGITRNSYRKRPEREREQPYFGCNNKALKNHYSNVIFVHHSVPLPFARNVSLSCLVRLGNSKLKLLCNRIKICGDDDDHRYAYNNVIEARCDSSKFCTFNE